MMPRQMMDDAMSAALNDLTAREEPFAIATVIRTAGATAAKPGAKALLRADGTIISGWLGGGCTKGAVAKAAQKAIQKGTPVLISVAPEDVLTQKGLHAGDEVDGVQMARNGCPSKGRIDIFVEPSVPQPQLVVFGESPVAKALAKLAPQFHWDTLALPQDMPLSASSARRRVLVVATQGQGDLAALKQALGVESDYRAFVGSRKKFASLAEKLANDGFARDLIDSVDAPAGLDIGAVTPEEIALSILARLTTVRRQALAL